MPFHLQPFPSVTHLRAAVKEPVSAGCFQLTVHSHHCNYIGNSYHFKVWAPPVWCDVLCNDMQTFANRETEWLCRCQSLNSNICYSEVQNKQKRKTPFYVSYYTDTQVNVWIFVDSRSGNCKSFCWLKANFWVQQQCRGQAGGWVWSSSDFHAGNQSLCPITSLQFN